MGHRNMKVYKPIPTPKPVRKPKCIVFGQISCVCGSDWLNKKIRFGRETLRKAVIGTLDKKCGEKYRRGWDVSRIRTIRTFTRSGGKRRYKKDTVFFSIRNTKCSELPPGLPG